MRLRKYRETSFTIDPLEEFINLLQLKLKAISPDLEYEVLHGDLVTTIIFSGSHLADYYYHQIAEASKESKFSPHNFAISRRGNNYIIKVKH